MVRTEANAQRLIIFRLGFGYEKFSGIRVRNRGREGLSSVERNRMSQPTTRASLIVKLKGERNELAWTEFVSAYEPFLMTLVARHGVPARHVPDVTQQVFIAISYSLAGWNDDGDRASFRRWVNRVARNIVIKFMSRERRQVAGQGGTQLLELLNEVPESPSDDSVERYDFELIIWAAEQVKSEFRETSWRVFWETMIEGRSIFDVANELNVSKGSIYMSRSRIMARIRAKVSEVSE
jgi:RNA polymerase sigma-70 factor, ECF subfamily